MTDALVVFDDDGVEVMLDEPEASNLFELTADLEAATVSACPQCRSRVLACVALVDVLDEAPPHARSADLAVLAEEAPTLHLYCYDLAAKCAHTAWRDPGYSEWLEASDDFVSDVRGPR